MAVLYDKVVNTIDKPPRDRNEQDIERLLPWFCKKSNLFQSLHVEIVKDIVKNCEFKPCKKDTVIIRQMDKGDCFYIILSGSVAIHINTTLTEEEYDSVKQKQQEEERAVEVERVKGRALNRTQYGIYVGRIDAGKSFGELALINADCVRNATIIADEQTDLISVDRDLYNRSLFAFQSNEIKERKDFVENSPLFHNWQARYKKMMGFSLKKKIFRFEEPIVRQGAPVDGISFIFKGQCKVRLDPSHHQHQYPQLHPLGDIREMEREKTREVLRREMNLQKTRVSDRTKVPFQRRSAPSESRRPVLKPLELCLARAIDTIGDVEMAMGLPTYSQTVECTEESVVYHLDQRNYDRLIEKRNPATLEMIRDIVHTKLTLHFNRLHEATIPLYRFFLYTLDEKEKETREASRMPRKKPAPQVEVNIANLQKGPLVNMYGPGSVFYLIRKKAKEMKLRQQRRGHGGMRGGRGGRQGNVTFTDASRNVQAFNSTQQTTDDDDDEGYDGHEVTTGSLGNYGNNANNNNNNNNNNYGNSRMLDNSDFIEDYDSFDPNDPNDLDLDDSYDFASSDSALTRLEERLSHWHSRFGDKVKGTKVVKLARYQYEEEPINRPKPGNKVYVRARTKPKNVSFFEMQNASIEHENSSNDPKAPADHSAVAAP